ncbi:MAG: nucleoside triphosphate pyrophosphohydrolase [Chloroflexi bacterium RBG_16_54_11]|nr:MAG: nucleoside triphosphate pyrophosphohydrolase [Chloroflexi bacterium RBG_16_54_11]
MAPHVTLVGLGPGNPELLTVQARQLLDTIPEIYLRTSQHPTIAGFPASLKVHSFDGLYENSQSYQRVYEQIVEQVLELARRPQGVVYAVPGHPYVAEATCPVIAERARQEGIPVQVIEGLSFIEPTLTALGIDPLPHLAIVDALELAIAHTPPFPPDAPALIAQIHSRAVANEVKLTLMETYPDEHPVRLVHAAGTHAELVEDLPMHAIDQSPAIGLLTSLYLPPLEKGASFESFQEIIAHLRAPDGCPWDREQTHQTLRTNLLEETYEALATLDADDPEHMREEFGDLLLQITLHAQIANEYGEFDINQVIKGIYDKIIRRHPHVFGDWKVAGVENVLQNWEKLKAAERSEELADYGGKEKGLLDGVAIALPALAQAEEIQSRVARVGFDWADERGIVDKINEECHELLAAPDLAARAGELGDLLFSVVNLARHYEIDAESALRETNTRFRKRFAHIEQAAREKGKTVDDLSLDEMEAYWQEAKRL